MIIKHNFIPKVHVLVTFLYIREDLLNYINDYTNAVCFNCQRTYTPVAFCLLRFFFRSEYTLSILIIIYLQKQ